MSSMEHPSIFSMRHKSKLVHRRHQQSVGMDCKYKLEDNSKVNQIVTSRQQMIVDSNILSKENINKLRSFKLSSANLRELYQKTLENQNESIKSNIHKHFKFNFIHPGDSKMLSPTKSRIERKKKLPKTNYFRNTQRKKSMKIRKVLNEIKYS